MARKQLIWHLFPTYLLVTLVSILAVAGYTSHSTRNFYRERTLQDLHDRTRLLLLKLPEQFSQPASPRMDEWCKQNGRAANMRITAILPNGTVIGDTREWPADMDNHAERPEIKTALSGEPGTSTRYSNTLKTHMTYVAFPVLSNGAVIGVLRTSKSLTAIDDTLRTLYKQIAGCGIVIALLAAAVSWFVSRRIVQPLDAMRLGAKRFAEGDLTERLPTPNTLEMAHVADGLNRMAADLDERINTIVQQRNEQDAILSSMVEGVLAVDHEQSIITINQAAAKLFGIESRNLQGMPLHTAVKNTALQEFVSDTLVNDAPLEREIQLRGASGQILQAHGARLRGTGAQLLGAVIVLNDVTRLRRLEQVRRDFVANVSHELKTPITSIKGFVETLQDGAHANPEDLRRFLAIIGKQANRMNAIIEDLLDLSRMEQENGETESPLARECLLPVLESAVQFCHVAAAARNVSLAIECPPDLEARINPALLEQGIVNLVDNAIKYSAAGQGVRIMAQTGEDEVTIKVKDQGRGISAEHEPRIFERFYRVDKARSRELGGTGLGLAIVKHIAQTHGGSVAVESELDVGSTFTITLPGA